LPEMFSAQNESIVCDRTIVLAIHRAIHTRPLPTSVSLPGGDPALVAKVKSYDGGSVDMATAKFLGANPTKDSKWGRKSRAGVAVTFINPARTGGWEPSCTVIESIGGGPATITKHGSQITVTGYNDQLNDGDESRTLSDASLVEKDDDGKPIRKRKANGTQITTIERSKTGRAKCQECKEQISKGALRFGSENNYRGHVQMQFRHTDCVSPSAGELEALDGWDALGDQAEVKEIIDTLLQGAPAISPTINDLVAAARLYENVD